MSDSVQPHRWQPTRLPHLWDSPGKNIGVDCHFLLQCMKEKSESEVALSCPILSHPMDCRLPGSSVHGIFQARVLEWGAIAFSNRINILAIVNNAAMILGVQISFQICVFVNPVYFCRISNKVLTLISEFSNLSNLFFSSSV